MIKVNKGPKPAVLAANAEQWTREYVEYREKKALKEVSNEAAPSRYAHAEVKAALVAEANSKCIYCETLIRHSQPGHIDHIKPQAHFPDLVCEWVNLGLCCYWCNLFKSDKWFPDDELRLINPFEDDPETMIHFLGPLPVPRNGSTRGRSTIFELKLDRPEMVVDRARYLGKLTALVSAWSTAGSGPMKEAQARMLWALADGREEYAGMVRSVLELLEIPGPTGPSVGPAARVGSGID